MLGFFIKVGFGNQAALFAGHLGLTGTGIHRSRNLRGNQECRNDSRKADQSEKLIH
jgi:hypothetical protein